MTDPTARAYLVQSEPEGPTDHDIRRLYCEVFDIQGAPSTLGPMPVTFARAVLARYGNRAPVPEQEVSQ